MSLTTGRTVRLSALALATGTLVATVATSAGAAPNHLTTPPKDLTYAGNTGSSVVSLKLNVPAGVQLSSLLGTVTGAVDLPNPISSGGEISLSLLNQTGSLEHDATGATADLATSVSQFAGGTLGELLTKLQSTLQNSLILNQTVTANLKTLSDTSSPLLGSLNGLTQVASLPDVLQTKLPKLTVSSTTGTLGTAGQSVIAGVQLGNLADLLPAGTLDSIESTLNGIVGTAASTGSSTTSTLLTTLQNTVTTITSELNSASGGVTAPLSSAVTTALTNLKASLTSLINELPTIVSSIEDGSIVSLNGLTTTHSVTTVGSQQVSTVSNKLEGLSLLGGFVTLDGFSNSLTTKAGGTAGTAQVVAQPNLVKATVGLNNELSAILGPGGLTLDGTVPAILDGVPGLSSLVSTLNTTFGTLQTDLNSILDVAGVQILADQVNKSETSVAADGSSAKGALSGLQVIVNPLDGALTNALAQKGSAVSAADPLLDISIGALTANSAAAVVTPARTVVATTPTTPVKRLPYTGADLPLTGGIAALLVAGGAAIVIRRRRTGADL
jgi:hypothetical protein